MAGRMTVCNMSHRGGGACGADRPGRNHLRRPGPAATGPSRRGQGAETGRCRRARPSRPTPTRPSTLPYTLDASALVPQVTWGTSPAMTADVTGRCPRRAKSPSSTRSTWKAAPGLHGSETGHGRSRTSRWKWCSSVPAPTAASKTCARGPASSRAAGCRRPASRALVVPGSQRVRAPGGGRGPGSRLRRGGGAEWRRGRLQACAWAMNPDQLRPPAADRQHQQPQLRGPSGRAAAPIWSVPKWRRPPPSPATSSTRRNSPWRTPDVQPFDLHTGAFVCLDRANIDTDAIVPARFLKRSSAWATANCFSRTCGRRTAARTRTSP